MMCVSSQMTETHSQVCVDSPVKGMITEMLIQTGLGVIQLIHCLSKALTDDRSGQECVCVRNATI